MKKLFTLTLCILLAFVFSATVVAETYITNNYLQTVGVPFESNRPSGEATEVTPPGIITYPQSDIVFIVIEPRFHTTFWQSPDSYAFYKESADGAFRVYYKTSDLADYAAKVLTHIASAQSQLKTLGYITMPYRSDTSKPYEIYIRPKSADFGSAGQACGKSASNIYSPKRSQLHIRDNLSSSGTYSLKYTVWHEFFHAIQYTYGAYPDVENSIAWMEATAEAFAYKMGSTAYTRGHANFVSNIHNIPVRKGGSDEKGMYGFCSFALDIGDAAVRASWENIATTKSPKSLDNINNALGGKLLTKYGTFAAKLYSPTKLCVDKSNWSSSNAPAKTSISLSASNNAVKKTATSALQQMGAAYFKVTTTSSTAKTLTLIIPSGLSAYYINGTTITEFSGTSVSIASFKKGTEIGVVIFYNSVPSNYYTPATKAATDIWLSASAS